LFPARPFAACAGVASHDLDIRGAGDLLGADQAGNIDAVGYDAYMELLQQAIGELRAQSSGAPPPVDIDCEIKIPVDARIPDAWLPDTALRLRLYRAFAGAKSHEELAQILGVAVDRYGPPPTPVKHLAGVMAVKLDARQLALSSVSLAKDKLVIGLSGEGKLQPMIAAAYIADKARSAPRVVAQSYRLTPDGKLHLPVTPVSLDGGQLPGPELVRAALRELSDYADAFGRRPSHPPASPSPAAAPSRTPGARPPAPARPLAHPTRRVFTPGPRRR
jgi:transcription-repair coupling factor (superfamily II helicase)